MPFFGMDLEQTAMIAFSRAGMMRSANHVSAPLHVVKFQTSFRSRYVGAAFQFASRGPVVGILIESYSLSSFTPNRHEDC